MKTMVVASSAPAMSLGNHVRKSTVAAPASTFYTSKSLTSTPAVMSLNPAVSRAAVVTKTSTPSSQPQPADLVLEGRVVTGVPTSNYDPTHVRVAPISAIEDTAGHHRVFLEEQRPVHGEFIGMNIHPRYTNRFLEPPRVDVRLSGSSPSTPSPAGGRPQDSEPHAPTHHSALPAGYDVVSNIVSVVVILSYFTALLCFYCMLP